jgi:TPR repeat protein
MYKKGKGVQQNYTEALKWYRKAADQGHARSQYNLGVMYANGEGVQRNYTEAVKWYQKAADQGHVEAQSKLEGIYRKN